jgi:hypothetical protein
MNIFDPQVSGSLSVSGSSEISGDLRVLGTLFATISGTAENAVSTSHAAAYTLTSSFHQFTSSYTTGAFTGSFGGNGAGLYNIPASGVTGLNLTRIADGSATASISQADGLRINTNTELTGSLKISNINLGSDKVILINVTDSGGKYFIDGVRNPVLSLIKGFTYKFLFPNIGAHPFRFSTTNDGTHNGGSTYSTGVTTGSTPDYIQIEITDSTPSTIYYYCTSHPGMGNGIGVYSDLLNVEADRQVVYVDPSRIATTGSNSFIGTETISGSLSVTGSVNITGSISLNGQAIGTGKLDEVVFNSYTSSNDTTNSLQNGRLDLLETTTSSLNTYTSSTDSKLNTIELTTGSLNSYTSSLNSYTLSLNSYTTSTNTRLNSIETSTGSLNSFTSSAESKLSSIETTTGSLNTFTSSTNNKLNAIETSTNSLNLFTSSADLSLNSVLTSTASLNTYTSSNTTNINAIHTTTSSLNTFSSSILNAIEVTGSNLTVKGNLLVKGTTTQIDSTTLNIGDNIISLNGTATNNAGLVVQDASGASTISGSLLWDTSTDFWKAGKLGSEERIVLVNEYNTFSTSIDSRATSLQTATSSLNSYTSSNTTNINAIHTATGSLNTFTSSANNRLDLLETSTGSLNTHTSSTNTRLGVIESTTGSLNTFTSSTNTRLNAVETSTGSLNSFSSSTNDKLSSLESASSSIRTDFNSYTSSNNTVESTQNGRLSALETTTGSLNTYTSSNTTNINAIHTATSSLNSYTSSTNTRLGVIESTTGSLNTYTSSNITNINAIHTATSSLNTFTSSINTTIKNKLNVDGVISGSIQVEITGTTGYSTFSGSIATTDSTQNDRIAALESMTGSYATTGSSNIVGNQTITGSVYITQNLTVLGSSSFLYLTASQLAVSSSTISVNVFEPAERFGGLKVYDSGSLSHQATASLLWDSQNNHWVYQNAYAGGYSGGMLISGPRNTGALGDEAGTIANVVMKGQGGDHITGSNITDTGTKVSINSNTEVTGTLKVTGNITSPNITAIETSTGSLNTFTSSILSAVELTGSNLTVKGNLLVKGTTTNVNTTTLDVDNNLINLNGTGATLAGLRVKDTTAPNQVSGSLLWDATNDYWIAGQLGSEQRLVRETEFNNAVNRVGSLETSTASLNTHTSSTNTRLGAIETATSSLNSYTSSTNSRLTSIETSTSSLNTFTSSAASRLSSLETASGSIRTDFNSYTSSNNTTNNTQNSRLNSIESTTGSLNSYTSSNTTNINAIHTATSSLNSYTSSNNTSISSLNSYTSSNTTNINAIHTATSSLNTFTNSFNSAFSLSGADVTVRGNFTVSGTTTTVNSTTVAIGDNIIQLNGSGATNAGIVVRDATSPTTTSGSLLWDTTNDKWIAGPLGSEDDVVLRTATQTLTNKTINASQLVDGSVTNAKLANSSFNIGTTSISLGRSSASQTLTGVSIDGNSATVTNGVYTTGDQTIGGAKTFSSNITNSATADWYMYGFGTRGASSGQYGMGLASDIANRTLSFHVPNHTAYSSSGAVPKFGWYSNGAVELMSLQSATGNLVVTGTIAASNLSGTNTGDQTNITGNAGTVTNGVYTTGNQSIAGVKTFTGTISVTAGEGREITTFMPSSYTTNDLVSGHEYGWYDDHWRLGMTRSAAAAGADFVVQWNGARRLSLTSGGNLSVTGTIGATNLSGTNTGDQTTISGNAGSATILQTARNIGGVSFNGSANIDLPGVNTSGNQNTTGTAANITASSNTSLTSLSNLATVGTITSGTWQGSSISTTYTDAKVTSVSAGTGISVNTTTGAVTVSTSQNIATSASPTFADLTLTGGFTVGGSLSRGTYTSASNYVTGADNIVLKGNSSGVSGIFFESEKDGTNINHPSDFAFIQFHSYGIGGSTGEANRLVIGASNDADDLIVLNPMATDGVKVRVGAGTTEYTVWHSGNLTNLNQLTNGPAYISGNQSISISGDATGSGTTSISLTVNSIQNRGFRNTGSNEGVNAQSLDSNGMTYVTNVDGSSTNLTGNATDGALYSQIYSSSWQHQIYGDYRTGIMYARGKNNGTWQSWKRVALSNSTTFSNVSSVSFTHNLGTANLTAQVFDSSNNMFFPSEINITSTTVTVTFAANRTGRLVVTG